jgi:hypothetical protein
MKIALILLLSLYSYSLWADTCSLHEVQGRVKVIKDRIVLILAPGTASETKLTVPPKIQSKYAPYLNHFVKTKIIIDSKDITTTSKLKDIKKTEHAIYDPLNAGSSTRVEKGEVKCP